MRKTLLFILALLLTKISSIAKIMAVERVPSAKSCKQKNSFVNIEILVVDDDVTSRANISLILQNHSLQDEGVKLLVTTTKNAFEALSTLRTSQHAFDLVITNLHMPGMDGLKLFKQIDEEFKIPVVIMSCNEEDTVVLKILEEGALFYIPKPVKQEDLKDVWKFVATVATKGKSIVTKEEQVINKKINNSNKCINLESSEVSQGSTQNRKQKGKKCGRLDQDQDGLSIAKKSKFQWTEDIHKQFLWAVNYFGLEKAVPSKILKHMDTKRIKITRHNVASHLQKYRIYREKLENDLKSSQVPSEKLRRSSFARGHTSKLFETSQYDHLPLPKYQNSEPVLSPPEFGGNGLSSSSNVQGSPMFFNTMHSFNGCNELYNDSRAVQQNQPPNPSNPNPTQFFQFGAIGNIGSYGDSSCSFSSSFSPIGTNYYGGFSLNSAGYGSTDNGTSVQISNGSFWWPYQDLSTWYGLSDSFNTEGSSSLSNVFGTLNPFSTALPSANRESTTLSQLPINNFDSISGSGDGSAHYLLTDGSPFDNFSNNQLELRRYDLSELLSGCGTSELRPQQLQGVQEADFLSHPYDVTMNDILNSEFLAYAPF